MAVARAVVNCGIIRSACIFPYIACSDVAVVILSQPEATHVARAQKSMQRMNSQCLSLGGTVRHTCIQSSSVMFSAWGFCLFFFSQTSNVLLAHEHYRQQEVVTIVPVLAKYVN